VRQVLGAIAQFDKATTVAKLKAARDRKIAAGEKCGGRKSYAEARPEMVKLARQLRHPDPDRRPVSLRKIAAALAERGYVATTGKPYEAAAHRVHAWRTERVNPPAFVSSVPTPAAYPAVWKVALYSRFQC
jgi:DNA invertase Pin-like site-specific DNA recombinase